MSQGMVSPCAKIENATTAKVTAMISPRSGMFAGSVRGECIEERLLLNEGCGPVPAT